ncbi:TetR/AcrR family transcriptional regulator [Rhodococcus sp. ARC_M6]|uniref:TetR/AcrR family transcriptional regulator n=1 Tax=Rhodococcus sp. ARC_M6 TaxID=2928852 RepID=UPI001FB3C22E|nr:TetR/AcrR family transcriptional regulator [Rhodococcus sp. ARC_M6]MCJ0906805.1 TetR/AcrR family transcriptional regulator [Rhodococcus sp. ARC_M6]
MSTTVENASGTTRKGSPSNADKVSRRQVDKFSERRDQLAEAALQTLAELGYARTSLREIAQNSEFSHGVLHYYFSDKVDLITHCVRHYKARCVNRYDGIVATAHTPDQLRSGFGALLAETMIDEPTMHRLWYDLRAQSLFEESFRADVAAIDTSLENMIWRIVIRYAELLGTEPAITSSAMYGIFDGLFQQSLLRHLSGDDNASTYLSESVQSMLLLVVPTPNP